jgi:hypothetical protein
MGKPCRRARRFCLRPTPLACFGKDAEGDAERSRYAEFLDEASVLLEKPALRDAAAAFRQASDAWRGLGPILLPDAVTPLGEARALMTRRHRRFLQAGQDALDEMRQIDAQLAELRRRMNDEFPLTQPPVEQQRQAIAAQIIQIHDAEAEAVRVLKEAMG